MSLRFSELGARQTESDIARLMTIAIERPELLSLAAGFTDNETLPLEVVSKISGEIGAENDRGALQYGANQGRADLRALLTTRLKQQDDAPNSVDYDPTLSLITNGSQQALYLAIQTLCDPGDIVLVEQPTYFVFLEMLRGLDVKAVPMPMLENGDVDAQGVKAQLEGLETDGSIHRVKAVYLVSYYANPSGHTLSAEAKNGVVEALGRFAGRIAVIEDAAYRELFFEQAPKAKSCLVAGVQFGVPVFYTTTLTKSFATGLKTGYGYCSHPEWLKRMLAIKGQQDFGSNHYAQAIFARAIGEGAFDAHLEKIRVSYQSKADALNAVLEDGLKGLGWTWEQPQGGLYIWAEAQADLETGFESALQELCLDEGVIYVPGELCDAHRSIKNRVRLSYGVLSVDALREAGKRFSRAAARVAATVTHESFASD